MCHIPQVSRCCRWRAVSRAVLGRWQRGRTPSPERCSGRKGDRGWGSWCPWGGGDRAMGSRERPCSPSCLPLPKKGDPRRHGFPPWSFPCAGIVHPVPHSRSGRRCQLVPGTEPSPWAATSQHPPEHLAPILRLHRGLFQQGSSSVLIQPCVVNQLLEKKEPSCFFGPGCAESSR